MYSKPARPNQHVVHARGIVQLRECMASSFLCEVPYGVQSYLGVG